MKFYENFLIVFVVMCRVCNGINHCQLHRFEKSINSTEMQFTKEAVTQEYAVLGEFKSLHCCAKGYRSIEWFKNVKPYPWPNDVSSLILYPEAENQTIYTRSASFADAGNYTCVLRNDTHKTEHFIQLNVVQGALPDSPLATYKPHDQFVMLNETVRLYCEAFVGRINLPDASNFIAWYQMLDDQHEQRIDGLQEIVTREDGQIIGAFLTISQMQSEDYGRYVCRIELGNGAAHRLELSAWIFGTPIPADRDLMISPVLLAFIAALMTVTLILALKYILIWYTMHKKRELNQCRLHSGCSNSVSSSSSNSSRSKLSTEDIRIRRV